LCYRESIFKNKLKNSFVENVVIKLSRNPGARETAQKTIALRQEKLPDWQKIGTAGSFFKNPFVPRAKYRQLLKEIPDLPAYSDTPDAPDASAGAVKIPAGRLLDELGWKGKRTGRVGTWPKHALVIVNYGGATGQEILDFATAMQADIKKNYDLVLEPEVNIVNPSSANNPKLCTHPPLP
jgi:UDP-N-acetylmuramate dehydrogenase